MFSTFVIVTGNGIVDTMTAKITNDSIQTFRSETQEGFNKVETDFNKMESRLIKMENGLSEIKGMLNG
ncbi:MAG: hypothetical protein F4218_07980 [Synechococcus sp. SB0677_bin_5]|nr:hypothetical protein [Synechococcus sp. SB0677_bin_5]